jgi:hypothetical protein
MKYLFLAGALIAALFVSQSTAHAQFRGRERLAGRGSFVLINGQPQFISSAVSPCASGLCANNLSLNAGLNLGITDPFLTAGLIDPFLGSGLIGNGFSNRAFIGSRGRGLTGSRGIRGRR